MPKGTIFTIFMPPDLRARIKAKAEEDGRSEGYVIKQILYAFFKLRK